MSSDQAHDQAMNPKVPFDRKRADRLLLVIGVLPAGMPVPAVREPKKEPRWKRLGYSSEAEYCKRSSG